VGDDIVVGWIAKQRRDQLGIHRMTRTIEHQTTAHRHPAQGQISKSIKNLVPFTFIRKTQPVRIYYSVIVKHQSVIQASTTTQTFLLQSLNITEKPKRTRWTKLTLELSAT